MYYVRSAQQNVNHTYFKIGKLYFSPAHRDREIKFSETKSH